MRRFSLHTFTRALMLAALLVLSASVSIAQVPVSLSPVTGAVGQSGTVNVIVDDLTGQDVIAFSFTVEFDPAVVEVTGASAGPLAEGFDVQFGLTDSTISVAGAGVTPIAGGGTLVVLDVDFIGEGAATLVVSDFEFNEGTPEAEVTDGEVTVTAVVVAFGAATTQNGQVTIPINTVTSLTGQDILSYEFVVEYDPDVLTLTGVSNEGTLSSGMEVQAVGGDGTLSVAAAGAVALEGEGTLINLVGEVANGGTTTISFASFQFNEGVPSGGGNPATITIGAAGQEGSPENPLQIPVAPSRPTLDGEMDEVWAQAKRVSIANLVNGVAPDDDADLSGDAYVMYDKNNLYVFYDVRDSQLKNDSNDSWQDDAVDLYIDGGNEKTQNARDANDAQFEFSWGDPENNITGGHQGNNVGVEYRWTTQVGEGGDTLGYFIEAVVPWHNFGVQPTGNNEIIGIEFMINDDDPPSADRDTKLAWYAEVDEAWQWSHVLGTAMLVGTPPAGTGDPDDPIDIPTTNGPPKIDGIIDLAWGENAAKVTIGNVVSGEGTEPADDADLSGEVWFMYDKGNLYVLYDINDSQLKNDSNDSWQDDAVDLYIDAGWERTQNARDANDAQYEFSWGDPANNVTGGTQGNDEDVRYAWATKVGEGGDTLGYIIEAQIPWKNFSEVLNPSGEGELIGIEFMINDDDPPTADRNRKMAWYANEDNAWQWSHVLGTARLIGNPVGSGDPWAPFEINYTATAPEIDGVRENTWEAADYLELNKLSGGEQPTDLNDLNPVAWLMYDFDNLYVYYQTPDEALFNDSDNTWQDDSFDLNIDGGNTKCFQCLGPNVGGFEFGYNSTEVTGNAVPAYSDGVEFVSVETEDGYAVEVLVPWANFGVYADNGTLIGLEIKANDDDEGGDTRQTKYGWYEGTDDAWQWAHVFGTAVLVGPDRTSNEQVNEQPDQFSIESVYPNPFNPTTTAVVMVREVGDYNVRIYNVLGQLIEKRLVSAQVPGRMELKLDFGRYASGLYLISVENMVTGKVATAKAMLTK